ncbi:MAG: extracellular solute-binding protein [Anaerolineae bacterium]
MSERNDARMTRRRLLKLAGLGGAGVLLAACQPEVVEKVVKETVVVEKEAEKEVVEVEKEVTRVVEKEVEKAPEEGPTLTLWAPKHFIEPANLYYADSARLTAMENNFQVEVQFFPWGEYTQKQLAAIEAGTLPDVLHGSDVPQYHAMGILRDVSDTFEEIGQTGGGFFETMKSNVTINDKQWAVPFHQEPQYMYYRTDIFGEAGYELPFDDVTGDWLEAVQAVTKPADRVWGFGNPFTDCPDGNNFIWQWVFAFGGSVQDEEGNVVINSPETLEAITFYCDLLTEYEVMPPGVTGWDDTGNNKAYLSGQCASVYNSGSIINAMRDSDPGWFEDTAVAPIPGPVMPVCMGGTNNISIPTSSEHPDLAAELIKGVLSPERYPHNLEAAGSMFFPVLRDYRDLDFFVADRINAMVLDFLEHVHFMHEPGDPTPWLGEIGDKWLWSEMTSRIAVEDWDPQEALDDFEAQVIEIKEKYEEQQA